MDTISGGSAGCWDRRCETLSSETLSPAPSAAGGRRVGGDSYLGRKQGGRRTTLTLQTGHETLSPPRPVPSLTRQLCTAGGPASARRLARLPPFCCAGRRGDDGGGDCNGRRCGGLGVGGGDGRGGLRDGGRGGLRDSGRAGGGERGAPPTSPLPADPLPLPSCLSLLACELRLPPDSRTTPRHLQQLPMADRLMLSNLLVSFSQVGGRDPPARKPPARKPPARKPPRRGKGATRETGKRYRQSRPPQQSTPQQSGMSKSNTPTRASE